MILDGKKLAQKILGDVAEEVRTTKKKIRLAVVTVGEDPVVKKFIEKKRETARSVDIEVRIHPFRDSIATNDLRRRLAEVVHEKKNSGVIVQLPLPPHLNTQYILNAVIPEKDVDVLSARSIGNFVTGQSPILPPVAGAVRFFFDEYKIDLSGKEVLIVGAGRLVGRPVALWLLGRGVPFSIISKDTPNPNPFFENADVIISGAGKPNFIKGDMVKKGVVIIDAGTSESEGKFTGDVDFESVSVKSSVLTPPTGGMGPVTIAILLKNLVTLAKSK